MKKKNVSASAEPIEQAAAVKKPRASKSASAAKAKETPAPVAAAKKPAKAAKKSAPAAVKATKKTAAKAASKTVAKPAAKTAAKAAAKPATKVAAKAAAKTAVKKSAPTKKAVKEPAISAHDVVEDYVLSPVAIKKAGRALLAAAKTKEKSASAKSDAKPEAKPATVPAGDNMEDDEIVAALKELDAAAESEEASEEDAGERAPLPEPKLERLQKILSMAGIASRRHAEEMILAGRIQVNGQVVSTLGAKADIARDHIRVDNKLLQGAERHRYFMLNKPKGYVTTVSDPEGRPTVMQLFDKLGERLYPVGRLDYLSEGLLLITNDGELANSLARAGSGVEKTYLVKVAGQPTEDELDTLRNGVAIERAEPGSDRVRTAPARVRQVRVGDNPWFEVVLIEGRNRELRKMFSAINHFVEKIRRVGYGPLILDVEPGKFRELDRSEVEALRLTAEGKLKPHRIKTTRLLPKEAGRPVDADRDASSKRSYKPAGSGFKAAARASKPFRSTGPRQDDRRPGSFRPAPRTDRPRRDGEFKPRYDSKPGFDRKPSYGSKPGFDRPRPPRDNDAGDRPARFDRPGSFRPAAGNDRPRRDGEFKPRYDSKPGFDRKPSYDSKPGFDRKPSYGNKPGFDRPRPPRDNDAGDRPARFDRKPGGFKPRSEGQGEFRPRREGSGDFKPRYGSKPSFDRKPAFDRPRPPREGSEEPRRTFSRPSAKPFSIEPYTPTSGDDRPRRTYDRPQGERPARPAGSRPAYGGSNSRPSTGGSNSRPAYGGSNSRPSGNKPGFGAPGYKPRSPRPGGARPGGSRPGGSKPGGFKSGGFKPRPGGSGRSGGSRPSGRSGGGSRRP